MEFRTELPRVISRKETEVDWAARKDDLTANPNLWGLVAENVSTSTPSQIRGGAVVAFRGEEGKGLPEFEFSIRRPEKPEGEEYPKNRADLWGRYTPPADA